MVIKTEKSQRNPEKWDLEELQFKIKDQLICRKKREMRERLLF